MIVSVYWLYPHPPRSTTAASTLTQIHISFLTVDNMPGFIESDDQSLRFSTRDGLLSVANALQFPGDSRRVLQYWRVSCWSSWPDTRSDRTCFSTSSLTRHFERTHALPRTPTLFHCTPRDRLIMSRRSIARMIPTPRQYSKMIHFVRVAFSSRVPYCLRIYASHGMQNIYGLHACVPIVDGQSAKDRQTIIILLCYLLSMCVCRICKTTASVIFLRAFIKKINCTAVK